jgi:hypothetical protein
MDKEKQKITEAFTFILQRDHEVNARRHSAELERIFLAVCKIYADLEVKTIKQVNRDFEKFLKTEKV